MKGYIEITATKEQIDKIESHYAKVDEFINQTAEIETYKKFGIPLRRKVFKVSPPMGCFMFDLDGQCYATERGPSLLFRGVVEQLKTRKPVLVDDEAFHMFKELTIGD